MIPGQRFVEIPLPDSKKIRVDTGLRHCRLPGRIVKLVAPAVKLASFIIGGNQQAAQPAIPPGPETFQPADFRVLPFELNTGQP